MAHEQNTAQALPTEPYLGRFSEVISRYHQSALYFVDTFQNLESALDCPEALTTEHDTIPGKIELLRSSHASLLESTQIGFNAIIREKIPDSEKAEMLATLFQYPLSTYAYTEGFPATGLGKLRPSNPDQEVIGRHVQNFLVHRETVEGMQTVLDKRFSTIVGEIPYRSSVVANALTGVLNKRLCELVLSNTGVELPEDVPLLERNHLLTSRNIGLVICAAGIIGIAVGKATAKHPLKLAGKLLP